MGIKLDKVFYQDKFKNFSFEFEEDKITGVLASSGQGKTLLSYLIAGIEKDYTGTILNTLVNTSVNTSISVSEDDND